MGQGILEDRDDLVCKQATTTAAESHIARTWRPKPCSKSTNSAAHAATSAPTRWKLCADVPSARSPIRMISAIERNDHRQQHAQPDQRAARFRQPALRSNHQHRLLLSPAPSVPFPAFESDLPEIPTIDLAMGASRSMVAARDRTAKQDPTAMADRTFLPCLCQSGEAIHLLLSRAHDAPENGALASQPKSARNVFICRMAGNGRVLADASLPSPRSTGRRCPKGG